MKHSYAKIDAHKVIELCLAEKGRLAWLAQGRIESHVENHEGTRNFPLFGRRIDRQFVLSSLLQQHPSRDKRFTWLDSITWDLNWVLEDVNRIMRLAQRSIDNGDGFVRLTTEDHDLIR